MSPEFPKLNLPSIVPKLEIREQQVYIRDPIREKMILLTPEEWVRQHMIALIINQMGYSKSLVKIESGLKYSRRSKRSDILIYDHEAKPHLLVECKSPFISLNKTALRQAATYNKVLGAPYISVTNGLKHYCWEKKQDQYAPLSYFPVAGK